MLNLIITWVKINRLGLGVCNHNKNIHDSEAENTELF